MLGNLTGWHLLIILAVVLLIFGAAKLPRAGQVHGPVRTHPQVGDRGGQSGIGGRRRRVAHSVGRATRIDSSACDTRIRWSGTAHTRSDAPAKP